MGGEAGFVLFLLFCLLHLTFSISINLVLLKSPGRKDFVHSLSYENYPEGWYNPQLIFFFLNQIHILESHWDRFLKQLFAVSEH